MSAAPKKKRPASEWKAEKLRKVILGAQLKAASNIEAALNDHPDGDLKWNDVPFRLRASLEMAKGTMALERARAANNAQETRSINLVILPAQAGSIEEWEQRVRERNTKAIDTTLGPALLEEKK